MYVFSTATIFTYVLKMKRNICPFQNTDYQHSNFCEKKNIKINRSLCLTNEKISEINNKNKNKNKKNNDKTIYFKYFA